ncbi:hypothetical protein NPIL_393831 [Nephila pilipes]|uniref:DUF5641 domain-containing protein n=1 Tax=Nephila pilipes TaxID=299642 RepID=A0A8X6QH54_NEPPI|nr:hypothetical protein NPIL_393831 [Nephila pilipes]
MTAKEYKEAENQVIKMIQKEPFFSEKDARLKVLETVRNEEGMICLKTKIINRKYNEDFLYPAVLHAQQEIVMPEYLGVLVQKPKRRVSSTIKFGHIALTGSDYRKRIDCPVGVIAQLIPEKDKWVIFVKIKTSQSTLLRFVQKIYPLEVDSSKDISNPCKDLKK